nr:retrovirus-related Pol polyprotein from transposon TNT 1-94 [Tanacetum cinerariifolium]
MSCLPDDIMDSVISCETAKATWTDLVHSFEGPSDTKENRIMDLKPKYQTFRAKPTESLSQTYTRYKTLLNNLVNDGVNLSKHEINVGFVNSLPEKWLTFSQGLRNANHTQTLDLDDIYGRFVYEDNLIQRSQADPIAQKDYKAEYKRLKAKITLLEANPSSSQNPKTFQPKNNGLVAETFDWDEDELLVLKQAKLDATTFQIQNTELTMLNHALQDQLKEDKKINEKWLTSSKKVSQCINEQIPLQKKKVLGGELFTDSSSKINENENLFVPASMGYDQELVPKTKDWVERLNPDIKLLNFNTGRIIVPESQAINESLESTKTLNTPESSKDSEAESFTPLPSLKIFQGASPSLEVMPLTFHPHSPKVRPDLGIMKHTKLETQDCLDKSVSGTVTVSETEPTRPSIPTEDKNTEQESKINELTKLVQMLIDENVNSTKMTQESNSQIQQTESSKEDHRTSDHEMYTASLKRIENYEAQPYKYASSSKQILKAKAKPFPSCTHCGFNDYRHALYTPPLTTMNLITSKEVRKFRLQRLGSPPKVGSQKKLTQVYYLCRDTSGSPSSTWTVDAQGVHFLKKKSQAPEMIMYFIRMVENQNNVKVKQIRTDNRTKFRNHELESFCDERGISHNFSSSYTHEQNNVAERKNRTLIEAARTIMNGSVLSKHFWTEAVRIARYTQNRSIIVKIHDKTPYEIFRERIPDISYFHVFGCPVFIRNHKDHLGKFDAKADDGYFLGYSFVSKSFRVFNTRRQQVEETYHVTFDESMEAIRFTNTSIDEIKIDDSSRYPPDEFLQEDDPSRQYQVDSDISYYIVPHGRSLTELTQKNHVSEVIVPNDPGISLTEDN